jgi:hypothetical protein
MRLLPPSQVDRLCNDNIEDTNNNSVGIGGSEGGGGTVTGDSDRSGVAHYANDGSSSIIDYIPSDDDEKLANEAEKTSSICFACHTSGHWYVASHSTTTSNKQPIISCK